MNENLSKVSLWDSFLKSIKRKFKNFRKNFILFSEQHPNFIQTTQLSFIYFFAIVDLLYAVLNNVFSLGYIPEILVPVYPVIKSILQSPIFKIWASPEKVFFLSYVVIEFMIVRSVFKFSKLIKYNVLLIFSLLMIQGLVISYWDLLFHREIASPVAKWAYDGGTFIHTDKPLAIAFFLNTFLLFIGGYLYLFIRAVQGHFATIPGFTWLTDSVAFWLRVKTPTMRLGKRKKDNKKKK
jgi:hypothetical protein